MRQAVRLEWRLLWRWLQQSPGESLLVAATAGLVLSTMGESAARFGGALSGGALSRSEAAALVGMHVWAAFVAGFAFVLASGELPAARRLLADLAMRPFGRGQVFLALTAVAWCGRHALASITVGLPLVILLASWQSGWPLAASLAALVVMMRMTASVVLVGSRAISAPRRVALTIALAGAAIAAGLAATAGAESWRGLPPMLVMQVILDGNAAVPAWLGLAAWTMLLAAGEAASLRLDVAATSAPARRSHTRTPLLVQALAWLCRTPSAMLHAELIKCFRWRRFLLSLALGGAIMALVAGRFQAGGSPLALVLFSLVPVVIMGTTAANLFATDRAGFQSFLVQPVRIGDVIRAKLLVLWLAALVMEGFGWIALAAMGSTAPGSLVAISWLLAAAYALWTGASGQLISVLFPTPSDPHVVGGALLTGPAAVVNIAAGAGFMAATLPLVAWYGMGRLTLITLAAAAIGLFVLAVAAFAGASRIVPRLIAVRREDLLMALTASRGVRS